MSKINKKDTNHRTLGSDSPKTLIAQAKREVPGFVAHFKKFEQQMIIATLLKPHKVGKTQRLGRAVG